MIYNYEILTDLIKQGDMLVDESMKNYMVNNDGLTIFGIDNEEEYAQDLKIVIEDQKYLHLFYREPTDNEEWFFAGIFTDYEELVHVAYEL